MEAHLCTHEETTAPDDQGYVICLACLRPVQRPMKLDEINEQIRKS